MLMLSAVDIAFFAVSDDMVINFVLFIFYIFYTFIFNDENLHLLAEFLISLVLTIFMVSH